MKKWLTTGSIALSLLVGAVGAAGASADEQAVKVLIDNKQLSFEVQPYIADGNTLVQFRTVFEALGLKVNWDGDKQEVTGISDKISMKLQIGSKTAWIDGKEMQLEVAPVIKDNVTFVPLRFIGEASGREVSWDGLTKTVYIASSEQQIKHVLQRQLEGTVHEDLNAVLATIDPSSPAYEGTKSVMAQIFTLYDLSYDFKLTDDVKVDKDQASVGFTQTTKKVKGPDFEDNKIEAVAWMKRVNGEWKVSQTVINKIDYLKTDQYKEEKLELSAEEQTKVLAVIEKDRQLSEKKDFDGLLALYDSTYPNLKEKTVQWKQLAAVFDFKSTQISTKIIKASSTEALVRVQSKNEKVSGPEFRNFNADDITVLKKQSDGQWKIANNIQLSLDFTK